MAGRYADIHDELRSVASDLLTKDRPGETHVAWPLLAQTGWIGLEAPESSGGAGATFEEVAIILEEMGRAAAPSAYLGGAVLGVATLTSLRAGSWRDALLRDVVSGSVRTAVALCGEHGSADVNVPFEIQRSGGGLRVHGRSSFVPDAGDAARLLLLANDVGGTAVIVDVATNAPGMSVTAQPVLDETRRLAAVHAEGVHVEQSCVLQFDGDPGAAVRLLLDRACVAVACDSLGLSAAMLSNTVSYAGVRHQFGRPIGSFQAVKHACADMLVQVCVCRQLVGAAVKAVADGRADATEAAMMAKSYVCGEAVEVVGKSMQLHGGIGYTWESGIHVYLKRAALNRALFGSPAAHRRKLAQRYLQRPI
jgi:alkylation response protein AidB-like acyl-CoA dehydrogenase